MPELLRFRGFKFFFYAKEGLPLEPPHVHVAKAGCEVKFWLTPTVRKASSRGMDQRTVAMLLSVVEERRDEFKDRWDEFFA